MQAILTNLFDNPILTRELRRRMRGKALIYSIFGYLGLMTLATALVLMAYSPNIFEQSTTKMLAALSNTGRQLYLWITAIQALLVVVIAPTITASLTTGEKERKTFDFLRVTTITPWMYVIGCFLSTVFYVTLALICAFPLLSLTFVYGGVTVEKVFHAFGGLFAASMILSAFGLYVSSVRERTRSAQGIIVFTVFGALLGGMLVVSQFTAMFGAAAAGAPAAAGAGPTVGSLSIPMWVLMAAGTILVTTTFLLLAARKLFEPDETRALSHVQFLVIAATIVVPQLVFAHGATVPEPVALFFYASAVVLLFCAAGTFAVGRMEVGDEIWHLKRVVPALRSVDQTVPYLIVVAGLFAASVWGLSKLAATVQVPTGLMPGFLAVSLAQFAFMCAFGRWATAISIGRRGAGRLLMLAGLVTFFVSPVVGLAVGRAVPALALVGDILVQVSPLAMLGDSVYNAGEYAEPAAVAPAQNIVTAAYVVLALGFLVVGEVLRHRRWRGFDYHYDMPAGRG